MTGWKDNLRPIRDGLRDLLPAPQPEPDLDERQKRQEADSLRGFAYFEDFDQLQEWSPTDADLIQRANTPLLLRPPIFNAHYQPSSKVLLCHDASGNYHEYESAQGAKVTTPSYTCQYLQYVDAFVYFSHKLVCIPPPTWTNTLHRNGVKSIGTFLVEPGSRGMEKFLAKAPGRTPRFQMASQLAEMARCYGFDGWLINIEKSLPGKSFDLSSLLGFLQQLRGDLGSEAQIIWYDALTVENAVNYQNSLNKKNLAFVQACGSLLTNYCWRDQDANSSRECAIQNQIPLENIYFGVDVWAQNIQHGPHKRVTYPPKGGGGTNTGVAVERLKSLGFSAGVFGPAWSFEHFGSSSQEVECAVWSGEVLPADLGCDCRPAHPHHTLEYQSHPMVKSAREFPLGSEHFLYSDFTLPFTMTSDGKWEAHVGRQAIQPMPKSPICTRKPGLGSFETRSSIFKLNMSAAASLWVVISFRRLLPGLSPNLLVFSRKQEWLSWRSPAT
ncbi:glycoside hydrolase family 85 protein [Aulographum hederae CBS 113979]|uniref:Glycoside hydrolase family 85 protein n=1 Tax=Aulographum hederae CBS 113979 TaxID=1176131 RepID=A0A6G1HC45_9PEZI|nr:glycoside hydrolase family 85 protein [Aulographum hederae CBS 113979]